MLINGSGQFLPIMRSDPDGLQTESAAGTGKSVPSGGKEDTVNISEAGRSRLMEEIREQQRTREPGELVDTRGHEGMLRLGLMALGQSTLDEWTANGLQVSEQAALNAAEAFQQGFRENVERNGEAMAGSTVALNRHQIVMNAQQVPDWFIREYEQTLSTMDNPQMKTAFEQGDTFFTSSPRR